ncbi:hypothetical protein VCHA53O466_40127 [Vibrio chagasii]|nr:hypothetical protein VCHA53O466_40127 [Vibrio chagasii]
MLMISAFISTGFYIATVNTIKQHQEVAHDNLSQLYLGNSDDHYLCEQVSEGSHISEVCNRAKRLTEAQLASDLRKDLLSEHEYHLSFFNIGGTIYVNPLYFDLSVALRNEERIYDVFILDLETGYLLDSSELTDEALEMTSKIRSLQEEALRLTGESYNKAIQVLKITGGQFILYLLSCFIVFCDFVLRGSQRSKLLN